MKKKQGILLILKEFLKFNLTLKNKKKMKKFINLFKKKNNH